MHPLVSRESSVSSLSELDSDLDSPAPAIEPPRPTKPREEDDVKPGTVEEDAPVDQERDVEMPDTKQEEKKDKKGQLKEDEEEKQPEKSSFEIVIDTKNSPNQGAPGEYGTYSVDDSLVLEEKMDVDCESGDNPVVAGAPVDENEVEEEILPDHWWADGQIPVFKPVSDSFVIPLPSPNFGALSALGAISLSLSPCQLALYGVALYMKPAQLASRDQV